MFRPLSNKTCRGILSLSLSQTCVSCYLLALELGDEGVEECVVEVLAAEEGVAVGGLDLKDSLLDLQDRDVKGSTAQIEDGDDFVLGLVHAVGQGSGGGFVDDSQDVQSGDLAGVLGGLALRVVEVGGHCDDGVLGSGAKVSKINQRKST